METLAGTAVRVSRLLIILGISLQSKIGIMTENGSKKLEKLEDKKRNRVGKIAQYILRTIAQS